jgi:YD repeat-containing protein
MRSFTRTYTYDLNNRLAVFQHDDQVITYTFDPLGNLLSVRSQQPPQGGGGAGRRVSGSGNTSYGEQEMSIPCPSCGTAVHAGRKFCSHCGAPVGTPLPEPPGVPDTHAVPSRQAGVVNQPASSSACPRCGAAVVSGKKFCPQCGNRID